MRAGVLLTLALSQAAADQWTAALATQLGQQQETLEVPFGDFLQGLEDEMLALPLLSHVSLDHLLTVHTESASCQTL